MKKNLFILLAVMPLVWACKKETASSFPQKEMVGSKPTKGTETTKTIHCYPYQDIYGYMELVDELNSFAACHSATCSANNVTETATNTQLQDPNGYPYAIDVNELITTTRQNEIINRASGWANANAPSGFFVSEIAYSLTTPAITSGTNLTINVTYRKCLGGVIIR